MKSLIFLLLTSVVWIHADGENIEINVKQMVYGCGGLCESKSVDDTKDESDTTTEGGQGSIATIESGGNQTNEITHTDVSTTQEISTTFNESTLTPLIVMKDCIWGNTTFKHTTRLYLSMCINGMRITYPDENYSASDITLNEKASGGARFFTLDKSDFPLYNINCRVDVLTIDGRRVVSANILTLPTGKMIFDEMTFEFNVGEPLTCRFYLEEIKMNCSFVLPQENAIIEVSNDVFVSRLQNQAIIETLKGIAVGYDGISLGVKVVKPFTGGVIGGIVGLFNGNKNDDYTTRAGQITTDVDVFFSSWKTSPNDNCTSSSSP